MRFKTRHHVHNPIPNGDNEVKRVIILGYYWGCEKSFLPHYRFYGRGMLWRLLSHEILFLPIQPICEFTTIYRNHHQEQK